MLCKWNSLKSIQTTIHSIYCLSSVWNLNLELTFGIRTNITVEIEFKSELFWGFEFSSWKSSLQFLRDFGSEFDQVLCGLNVRINSEQLIYQFNHTELEFCDFQFSKFTDYVWIEHYFLVLLSENECSITVLELIWSRNQVSKVHTARFKVHTHRVALC